MSDEPDPHERCPYGIGSDHWPGVGKVIEESGELGLVFGKLFGSGGNLAHWSGDLGQMMQDEIADLRAALEFMTEANAPLRTEDAIRYMERRYLWKFALFSSWHRGDPEGSWPKPEEYGLPAIEGR